MFRKDIYFVGKEFKYHLVPAKSSPDYKKCPLLSLNFETLGSVNNILRSIQ